jgi:hypothetical protein
MNEGFDPLGDVLRPVGSSSTMNSTPVFNPAPQQTISGTATQPQGKLAGDLDSALASLAENLTIDKCAPVK